MDDVLGYEGARVVVTGAASGMGEATASLLVDLGAHVIGLDRAEISAPVAEKVSVDLTDPASITEASAQVTGPINAFFNVAGLPGPPFSELDVVLVNFVGGRELIEQTLPKMPAGSAIAYVASAGGIGWQQNLETLKPLLETDGFVEARDWLDANPDAYTWSGYAFSKQVINAWTGWRAPSLYTEHQIRLNCTNPGPTTTAMMPFFHEANGKEIVDAALGAVGRYSTPEEQAWPLLFLNSPRASYVLGEAFFADGGFFGAIQTGQFDMSRFMPAE